MKSLYEKAEMALRMVAKAPVLVVDTETSGLDWKRNYAVGYVFTVENESVYIPVRHGGGGNLPCSSGHDHVMSTAQVEDASLVRNHRFEEELVKAFALRTGQTVGHNLKFDAHFMAQRGIMLGRNLSCTQNNQTLVDEYTASYSLSSLSKLYKIQAKKDSELYEHIARHFGLPIDRNVMGHYWRLPGTDTVAVDYAEGDGISTWQLHIKQQAELDRQGVSSLVREVENELIWTLVRIERRGMKIDVDYVQELKHNTEARVAEAYAGLPANFNVRSPQDVARWMTDNGHTDWPVTEKGNPSFTEKWLKQSDAGARIIQIRKWSNLLNSFVEPLIGSHTFKGRVHPQINQNKADDFGTISGRLSCSSPNLQQVPKHNKELAKEFRKAFVADDGFNFYEADYSQCEPRLFAHYSSEPALVDGYSKTPFRDVHTVVAELFSADRNTVAKRMNMGMFTGMYPPTFAQHMGVSLEEATRLWNKWFEGFPKIRDFQNQARKVFLSRGYVKTLLGRHCRMDNKRFAYKATSKIIQGGNADIMKFKMVEVDKWLESTHDRTQLLMTIHDSFVWQAKDDKIGANDSAHIVDLMNNVRSAPFNLRVPFAVDCDHGKTWSEASFG
jgi:DNA polymerase-1